MERVNLGLPIRIATAFGIAIGSHFTATEISQAHNHTVTNAQENNNTLFSQNQSAEDTDENGISKTEAGILLSITSLIAVSVPLSRVLFHIEMRREHKRLMDKINTQRAKMNTANRS